MTKATPVLLGIGAFVAYNIFAKKGAAESLKFDLGIPTATIELDKPVLTVPVIIQNPTNTSMGLRSVAGDLTANGYVVANVSSFDPLVIGANAQNILNLKVRVSMSGIVSDIFNAINSSNGTTQLIRFTGSINVDGINIPLIISRKIL